MSGGESMKHRLAKHRIRELAPILSFAMETCDICKWSRDFKSDGHTVNLEVQSYDKRWRYDCMANDKDGIAVFALEVVNTHYSSQKKIDSTRSCIGFAEFMVDNVLQSVDGRLENIRQLDCSECPNCKSIAAENERLLLERQALEAENRRLIMECTVAAAERARQSRERRAIAMQEKYKRTPEQTREYNQFKLAYLDDKERHKRSS